MAPPTTSPLYAKEAPRPNLTGAFFVLAAGMLWGTTGTTQALAPAGAGPLTIGPLRLLVGSIVLLLPALYRGGFGRGRWPVATTFMAGAGVACYQICFFSAVRLTGVAVGTLVGIGSSPIIAGILGYLFRGERPGRSWGVATLLALVGCGLLAGGGGGISVNPFGILLALGAGASYAGYTMLLKGLLPGRTPDAVMAVVFSIGAILLLPLLFLSDLRWVAAPSGIGVVLYLGVLVTALSYWLFATGLRTVPVATAVTLSLVEPLTAALLGVLLLGERLSPLALSGIPLLFAGLLVLARSMARR
ncbi:DMT family transporter [Geomesophilobacter sediminis]|uniref:EamA family transporter n=1 Tax=Geomesophilobacter sediminis TaxID=2798584 RepID=A0A8J7LZ91_9BACT|nr:EamA family transporter [Geomesophilobacter sediminis]MBJ6726031.1 EamA family transporter [Geomesophilobacter sediminis]